MADVGDDFRARVAPARSMAGSAVGRIRNITNISARDEDQQQHAPQEPANDVAVIVVIVGHANALHRQLTRPAAARRTEVT